jgi:glycosyltransferase involved in cell wall biosynthesis
MREVRESLSVVLATYNEEANIADCLLSVKDMADEIIVVDGGSTDKTVAIAKSFGAKVTITDNPPIFHINKQKAIDKATKDWILQLDADERVTKELKDEILSVLSKDDRKISGYWIPRKNYFLGRFLMKGGQYPDYTLRLYRRGKGRLPQKDVHEQAIVEGQVGKLHNPLIHMSDTSFQRYLLRFHRYTDLLAENLRHSHPHFSLFMAMQYLLISPIWWFVMTYGRHKGFMDSWQGFAFSFFSALRFPVSYIKYLRGGKKQ